MGSGSAEKLRKRRALRRKDVRTLVEEAGALLAGMRPAIVEQAELEDGTVVFLIDGAILLARAGDVLFPTMKCPCVDGLPSAVVDMGAVPYVCNGADVMAPGVVDVRGDFQEGSLVVVRDAKHGKALAIGEALVSSGEIKSSDRGKVVRNIHYVGDRLWSAYG